MSPSTIPPSRHPHRRSATALLVATLCAACFGGPTGTTGSGPIEPPPPPPREPSPAASGLIALAAGNGQIRADYTLPGTGFEAALFVGADHLSLFGGAPLQTALTGTSLVFNAPADATEVFVGLAIRPDNATDWRQSGAILRCRPNAPIIYADATAAPNGNGTTPATAYDNLTFALLAAGAQTFLDPSVQINVWVRDGIYDTGPFPIAPDVHVQGGFQDGFALADRQPAAGGTRLVATTTVEMIDVSSGGRDAVFDGLSLDGGSTHSRGVNIVNSDCELRSVTIRGFTSAGLKDVTTIFTNGRDLTLVACNVAGNGTDGMSVIGLIDLVVDRSQFDANGEEGIDFDDMIAIENRTSRMVATGCRFFGNGAEGLDMDLNVPALANAQGPGGVYDVRISGCLFERNALEGLLVDQEHDFFPNWYAHVEIRDCIARANFDAGVHIDADSSGDYLIHRLRSCANVGDGVLITSETAAGELLLASSSLTGNLGYGVRTTLGNKMVLASHCVFAGNEMGGFRAEIGEGAATSCILWRQPNPLTSVRQVACSIVEAAGDDPFFVVPRHFAVATGNQSGQLTLQANPGIAVGDAITLADDGVLRTVTAAEGTTLTVTPAPSLFLGRERVFGFPHQVVAMDLRLVPATPLHGTGMAPVGQTLDPGPHGAPAGGEPGAYNPFVEPGLHLLGANPPVTQGLGGSAPLVITFDRNLDPASVTQELVRAGTNTVLLDVQGAALTLTPTVPWTGPFELQLHAGLRGNDGTTLGNPVALPLRSL